MLVPALGFRRSGGLRRNAVTAHRRYFALRHGVAARKFAGCAVRFPDAGASVRACIPLQHAQSRLGSILRIVFYHLCKLQASDIYHMSKIDIPSRPASRYDWAGRP